MNAADSNSFAVDFYYGAASGQQRSALRRLDPEGVMISHATACNTPWEGDYRLFIDCGGYHHMVNGTGEYATSHDEYLDYIEEVEPHRWALRDYPCEPDLIRELGRDVREHQSMTTDAHVELLNDRDARGTPGEAVAVLQGWTTRQYLLHLDEYFDRGVLGFADEPTTVAIGSVCRRGYDEEIAEIILAVRDALPARYNLHAFGVKGSVLRFIEVVEALDSVDSAAYDWAESRVPSKRSGESFTWRDAARAYLNWRHQLEQTIGSESLEVHRYHQTTLGGGTA